METPTHWDALTLGETMAALHRKPGSNLFQATPAGAESNVAIGMAQLGCSTRWVSRVGDDDFGLLITDAIGSYGVDIHIQKDDVFSTGLMVKEINAGSSRVHYYRSQSAARGLNVNILFDVGESTWFHLTGVTPALSAGGAEVVAAIVEGRSGHNGRVSFDVNYRPTLWPDLQRARDTLIGIARRADLVFIGDDEAECLLGTTDVDEIAGVLLTADDQELVMKRGSGPATYMGRSDKISVPARPVEVVDVTGAGDAFASGYLAADCWGWDPASRLRLGHFMAARVVGSLSDLGPDIKQSDIADLAVSQEPPLLIDRSRTK